ncbi:MAG: CBS domain-containing protein [Anaerolineae bacterium]|nr:CBS domain-containing protein [Anaerolineae bacterium]
MMSTTENPRVTLPVTMTRHPDSPLATPKRVAPRAPILYNKNMLLILTHENADFDAVASLLGAYKLNPEGIPLLPRRVNRNVMQFLTLYWDALPYMRPEDWQKRRVDEVLLVDTHSLSSVRGIIKKPDMRVIDHHVGHKQQEHWHYHVEAVGATTTLLVEQLRHRGLALTSEEATLLMLGIYEDTGSLTYDTTTSRDIRAASWLAEQGAQLPVLRRFLNIPLTPVQRDLYDSLQANARWETINGQNIVIAAVEAPPKFDDEISSVVHRLRDAMGPDGMFVLVHIGRDVQVVARSNRDAIDVAAVAKALGGGGHNRAAAAMVVGKPLAEVVAQLAEILPQAIEPMARVMQIMSYGVQTLEPTTVVEQAAVLMQRFGHEGYPVVDSEKQELVGLLTRRAVDRAISHDLGRLPVSRIMKMGAITVRPSDSVERVQQLMLQSGWGQIPVVADSEHAPSHPIGVVTRTDLLNYLFQPPHDTDEPDMRQLLYKTLSSNLWAMVLAVSGEAAELDMPLYFVGGLVRDLLLGYAPTDLDMIVEGDAIVLARVLQENFGGLVHTHRRFGTAKWFVTPEMWQQVCIQFLGEQVANSPQPDDLAGLEPVSIDFVTARTEFYKEPSALPEIERGSIKLDLHRRDFTINTLAVRLDGAHLGELLDFYNGRLDLQHGLVRVLHSLSFIDDPTRILRAVRYEQRLNFTIEPRTAELIGDALPMMDRVTGDRIRHEIERALKEAEPVRVMERLHNLGVLAQIHPALGWSAETAVLYQRVPEILQEPAWLAASGTDSPLFLYFALWLLPLTIGEKEAAMARLKVRKTTHDDVISAVEIQETLAELPPNPKPSEVVFALRFYLPRSLLVVRVASSDPRTSELLDKYVQAWMEVKTAVTGNTLREMGLKPGPEFAIILDRLLAARLDGEVVDEAGELVLLADLLSRDEALKRVPRRGTE